MASACMILRRSIATSCVCYGKRNFRKFLLYNKRGSRQFKKEQTENPDPDVPIDSKLMFLSSKFIYFCSIIVPIGANYLIIILQSK